MNSVWWEDAERPNYKTQKGDIKTDVLIVGGGITGILCAYMLECAGIDYALVEADRICSGITKNTTAKITAQHGLIYDSITRKYGVEAAGLYLESNLAAIEDFRRLSDKTDCDFEEKSAYVYSVDNREALEAELSALDALGYSARMREDLPLPFDVVGAIEFPRQVQFNPLKLLFNLSEDLNIYEYTKVFELGKRVAFTNRGKIKAENIIITTHFPILNKHGGYFLKLYQHRSYVLELEQAPVYDGMYIDENEKGLSFRGYKSSLLIGGGAHRTGKSGGGYSELERIVKRYYPVAAIKSRWATQDCMSLDGIPYIGSYSSRTENLFVATGYNKWGMTSSMLAARMLTDRLLGKEHPGSHLFSPSRKILHPQLFLNMYESIKGLVTPTVPRCPHLGCALKYNKEEHSWDCPCHGSRFTREGKLIDNPATDDKDF